MPRTLSRSIVLAAVIAAVAAAAAAFAENVDPSGSGAQYAWGENVGWISAEPAVSSVPLAQGVTVSGAGVTGFMYGENIGWINMNCANYGTCGSSGNYGVTNDGLGILGGYAWGENVGWISFSCNNNPGTCGTTGAYGVHISPATGEWTGDAWGENIGWINFDHAQTGARVVTDDGDAIAGASDNCPFDANADQTNTDAGNRPSSDLFGDVCDVDDDGDTCTDAVEIANQGIKEPDNPLDYKDFPELTGDAKVSLPEVIRLALIWNQLPGDPGWDADVLPANGFADGVDRDLSRDGKISLPDVIMMALAWNRTCP